MYIPRGPFHSGTCPSRKQCTWPALRRSGTGLLHSCGTPAAVYRLRGHPGKYPAGKECIVPFLSHAGTFLERKLSTRTGVSYFGTCQPHMQCTASQYLRDFVHSAHQDWPRRCVVLQRTTCMCGPCQTCRRTIHDHIRLCCTHHPVWSHSCPHQGLTTYLIQAQLFSFAFLEKLRR